ncbi:MAG: gliding motility-associated C-terminal domain-containing protein [Bacteroidales bacterium]|nr:gliding motility-associated C-terminal domain-containing protein [Bacteroidales bacterium]
MALIPVAVHGQTLPYACAGSREAYGVDGFKNSLFIWTIEGGEIVEDYNNIIVVEWDWNVGTHRLEVVEITESACIGTPVTAFLEVNAPQLDIGGNELEICENDVIIVDPDASYMTPLSYEWQDGSSGNTYTTGNEGLVWVRATGTDGCYNHDSATIIVNPLPIIDLGRDTALCGTATIDLDAGFFAYYDWSTNEIINPITVGATSQLADTISVEVTDFKGCKGSDTIVIYICEVDRLFADIPNTIIVGHGSPNEKWVLEHIGYFPGAVVEIFDRWGRLIYHVEDPDPFAVWDGRSQTGKEMPMDSYYYVIDLKYRNSEPLVGTINVIK